MLPKNPPKAHHPYARYRESFTLLKFVQLQFLVAYSVCNLIYKSLNWLVRAPPQAFEHGPIRPWTVIR